MAISLTPQENSGFCLNIGSDVSADAKTILINPVLTDSSTDNLAQSVHYVLLTHLYDKWEDALTILNASPHATLVAQEPIVAFLKSKNNNALPNVIRMTPGNELDFPWAGTPGGNGIGSLVMTANTSDEQQQFSLPETGTTYEPNGFIVNAEGHQVYYSGPCPFNPELRSIGLTYKPDVSILSFSKELGYATSEEIARSVMWLGSDIVLPIDCCEKNNVYDEGEIYSSIDIYTAAICRSLQPGQSYVLEPTASSGRSSGPETRY